MTETELQFPWGCFRLESKLNSSQTDTNMQAGLHTSPFGSVAPCKCSYKKGLPATLISSVKLWSPVKSFKVITSMWINAHWKALQWYGRTCFKSNFQDQSTWQVWTLEGGKKPVHWPQYQPLSVITAGVHQPLQSRSSPLRGTELAGKHSPEVMEDAQRTSASEACHRQRIKEG